MSKVLEIEALDMLDRVTVGKQGAHVDNVNMRGGPNGNARQYALRKLRKDAPELHAKVLVGELSPHRAMVQAGFRRQATPLQLLERAWSKATPAERSAFMATRDAFAGYEALEGRSATAETKPHEDTLR